MESRERGQPAITTRSCCCCRLAGSSTTSSLPTGLDQHAPSSLLCKPHVANAWPTTSSSSPSPPSPLSPRHQHPQHHDHHHQRCPPPSSPLPSPHPVRHARVQCDGRIPHSFPQTDHARPLHLRPQQRWTNPRPPMSRQAWGDLAAGGACPRRLRHRYVRAAGCVLL